MKNWMPLILIGGIGLLVYFMMRGRTAEAGVPEVAPLGIKWVEIRTLVGTTIAVPAQQEASVRRAIARIEASPYYQAKTAEEKMAVLQSAAMETIGRELRPSPYV